MWIYFESNIKLLHAHFLGEFRGIGRNFGSFMRTTTIEYSQWMYSHGDELIEIHVSIGNDETNSNG
jgi:hypothetical protein